MLVISKTVLLFAKKPELLRVFFRAENETRTRDPDLGKVVLYQLSYFRFFLRKFSLRLRLQRYNLFSN